jgi:integrase
MDDAFIFCPWCGNKQVKERNEISVPAPRKLKSGSYSAQLMVDGKRVSITAPSEKEYYAKARAAKAGLVEIKENTKLGNFTLSQAIDNYILARTNTLSPLTIRGYRIIQKNRFRSIQNKSLNKIEPCDWQKIVNEEAGVCSQKTLKNSWGFIRSVVKDATGKYPPDITLPAPEVKEKLFLTADEIKIFVSAIKDTKYAVPSLLALSSLRISEIEALRWEKIPINAELIKVNGAVVLDEKNNRIRKEKNKNATSTRNVPVFIPELANALERDRQAQGPVMTISQNSLRQGIKKVCEKNNLPNVGIHGLRHSFASLAYHLQMPEKIAAEIGGWADASTMHKIYTHIAKSDIDHYKNSMSDFYNGNLEEHKGTELRKK